ncbi:MAG: GNAT family N-acetyltransferase [Pseudomonadota bacterium]
MTLELARDAGALTPADGVVVAAPFAAAGALLSPKGAAAIEAEWADLAANAVEANPFYSPSLLIPALDAFAGVDVRVAIVRDARGRLIALAPVAPARGYSRLPVKYIATWMHDHCFYAAPLIRKGAEAVALAALFDLAEKEGAFFRLRHLDAQGPVAAEAKKAARSAGRLTASSARFERALLEGGFTTEDVLDRAMRGKKRKELRRLRSRLKEQGAVVFETLASAGDVGLWTEEFLELESAGWKGGTGTALASAKAGRAFFAAAVRRAFAAGSLDFHRLTLAGKPIAMIVNFIENGAGYSFKIAYDEAYARFSPGVMLEIDLLRAFEQRAGLRFVDSCAARDHPMINTLWRGRRSIEALNVSGAAPRARLLFQILTGLERAGERLRRTLTAATTKRDEDADL